MNINFKKIHHRIKSFYIILIIHVKFYLSLKSLDMLFRPIKFFFSDLSLDNLGYLRINQ
jgi:hypothetical protein